ncbi:hypothetical protein TIMSHEL_41 [Mycobacterium phage Timshel]|uniref:Uncharacterized protein n=1 Tax=Mycobacterium phage Timshel TaxID=1032895 RepID=G1DB59_9CAUD|nr:hypothetical protein FDI10_gp53 [Mycobacterium phage Timshel]AEJ92392.1 hypothetical protein TIMSHEL_41 [Mycobacterium phage Timshel]
MRWGGEGDSPSIAPLRPPQTEVYLSVDLPYIPDVIGEKGEKLAIRQVAANVEGMSIVERTWAIEHLLKQVNDAVLQALREKGVIGGG